MKLTLAAIGVSAAIATNATAQDDAPPAPDLVLTNAMSRAGVDLTGEWHYSIDPYGDGVYGFHGNPAGFGHQRFDPVNVDEFTKENPRALFEYDMRQSPTATLPQAWDAHTPEMRHYEGLVWYDRGFEAQVAEDERAFLRFGAVNYTAKVYLNGEFVCEHEGGFTPFSCEVTDLMQDGENRVTLGVDSTRARGAVPSPITDWETYGGITRPVKLVVTPETFINDAWIRLDDDMIRADIQLDGSSAQGTDINLAIPELDLTLRGTTDESGFVSLTIAEPEALTRWSPEDPTLYDVTVTAAEDTLEERIGFRTVAVAGEELLLNGEPIFLRGINMHEEEFGDNPGRVMTEENARALLSEIKDGLNGNFVRLAHYPHAEVLTRLADEMGLLVWSEIPVYWRIDWENEATLAIARQMQAENILRDRNRASVILWSISNETPVSEKRTEFLQTLAADVRALDDTRLVTSALLTTSEVIDGVLTSRVDDPLTPTLDVMAVNTYHGWYGELPLDDISEVRWVSDENKPLIFSEFGAGAKLGFSEPELMRKFSVELQAEIYRETLEMSEDVSFAVGLIPWILKDFRSPRRQHPVYQEGWNRKGVLSETGERKPAFDVLADHYEKLAEE